MLKIELIGVFRLLDPDGNEIEIAGKHAPALLAIVATSLGQERSREFLKSVLWPRSSESQSAASLRSLLSSLRSTLGEHAHTLDADRKRVRLQGVTVEEKGDGRQEFFEDAPHIGEEFEDWLTGERTRVRGSVASAHSFGEELSERRICVALYPPKVSVDDPHASLIADRIMSQILQSLGLIDMVDVIDLSISPASGSGAVVVKDQAMPDLAIQLSMSKVRNFAEVGIRAFEPNTRHVFWNASISADQTTTFLFTNDQLDEFANQATDAVYSAILKRVERGAIDTKSRPRSMFGAVHLVLGMSPAGQVVARNYFRDRADLVQSSVAAAWYAFSLANTLGEGDNTAAVAEEASAYCRRAIELDPTNALTLALVSHVQSFVLRRVDIGAELLATSRKLAPKLAIAWDLSAMNALYRGEIEDACRYSGNAVRLGRFSPYQPLYQSSQAIVASVSGDHNQAINVSRKVLSRIPDFLAVERHLAGSLAAMGRLSESRVLVEHIRRRDPKFISEMLDDPSYPLPSPMSVELIRKGLSSIGLKA